MFVVSRYQYQQVPRPFWAQVNGRNAITWEEKFKLDVWYADNWSLWLDVKIILMTVWKVLKREGISQAGHATAQEFLGPHAKAQRRKSFKQHSQGF